ncbi:MAG TPA: pyruvate:ferredoxin (flavodoxin) oxidoreductase [Frankiaceae bacterium]|nr:pyruvate:ferredoxin (flavodoxin) oxidoreductase [Frankiaceae bacterium]
MTRWTCVDGNEAAARVAYALSDVVAIYPITPASPMGESADAWSAAGRPNLWGTVPRVVEMQSEAGAAGVLHGAVTTGALATTFTASQGLLLMLPDMYKVAGELTPAVIHVAARTVATHALSIFGDHSDVMAARMTGWAMLCASSVQEAHDFALVAHAASLRSRVPFLHFFDGFRTSHEVGSVRLLRDEDLRALVSQADVDAHGARGLTPERPVVRGTAQNPDVFFQAREASTPFHAAVPGVVRDLFAALRDRTGRAYGLVDYAGAPDAERVLVLMGSGAGAATEAVEALAARGEKVGVVTVRLFRPFPSGDLVAALPPTTARVAVLDRTKEPGAVGDPLYQDVVTTFAEAGLVGIDVVGARYGLSSKEFTPAMAKAVLDELALPAPRRRLTVGILDDVSGSSVLPDESFEVDDADVTAAVFYGLGSDGTVGANKAAVKIVGERGDTYAQGYFVYDSKKSGSMTVSHLRFSPRPIRSTYLVRSAAFVACHQFSLLDRADVLDVAADGATFLVNSPYGAEGTWDRFPAEVQQAVLDKGLRVWVIDAYRIARDAGLGGHVNTVMQPCFFALSGVLPKDEALEALRRNVAKAYAARGPEVVAANLAAIDSALGALHEVAVPALATAVRRRPRAVPAHAPEFVRDVTAAMLEGRGDLLPVSALPADGTFPTGTATWEKRGLATELPVWDPSACVDCGKCTLVCPHAAIRMKAYDPALAGDLASKPFRGTDLALTIQVAPDDCTGCAVCVDVCPARGALVMAPVPGDVAPARRDWEAFVALPETDRDLLPHDTVKGTQVLQPLFEFSGACAGCGETPYLKLLTQLFGDRMLVANATGCSSIFGGNLPTTPWSANADGRGPAWSNSLFEDNAEFGLGIRVATDQRRAAALARLTPELAAAYEAAGDDVRAQRAVADAARPLLGDPADDIVDRSVWIVGGDGWAYDIGFGGLDHVLASGENVNVLVLDTEVYSNTGGQASKSTPRGAVAKFAASGKVTGKKDLGLIAMTYGGVYVARVALGANDVQTVRALLEAEAWPGPSLVIAYATCIAHGTAMATSMTHQKDAVRSGYWPLFRFRPGDEQPLRLDSREPAMPVAEFALAESRYASLARSDPERSAELLGQAQADVDERWLRYVRLAAPAGG